MMKIAVQLIQSNLMLTAKNIFRPNHSGQAHFHCVSLGVLADGEEDGPALHARRHIALRQHLAAFDPSRPPLHRVQHALHQITLLTTTPSRQVLLRPVLVQIAISQAVVVHRLILVVITGDSQSFLRAESDHQITAPLDYSDCILVELFGEYFGSIDKVVQSLHCQQQHPRTNHTATGTVAVACSCHQSQPGRGGRAVGDGVILLMGVVWVMTDCFGNTLNQLASNIASLLQSLFRTLAALLLSAQHLFDALAALLLHFHLLQYVSCDLLLSLHRLFQYFDGFLLYLNLSFQSFAVDLLFLEFFLRSLHFQPAFLLVFFELANKFPQSLLKSHNSVFLMSKLGCKVFLNLCYLQMEKDAFVNFFPCQLNIFYLMLLPYCIPESKDSFIYYNLGEVFSEVGKDVFRRLKQRSEQHILFANEFTVDGHVELVQNFIVQHLDLQLLLLHGQRHRVV